MFRKTRREIMFRIDVCVESDEDRFYAYCPALEGVHVDGDTREEAIENVKLACILYIKSLIKHGEPIPLQIKVEETKAPSKNIACTLPLTENVFVAV